MTFFLDIWFSTHDDYCNAMVLTEPIMKKLLPLMENKTDLQDSRHTFRTGGEISRPCQRTTSTMCCHSSHKGYRAQTSRMDGIFSRTRLTHDNDGDANDYEKFICNRRVRWNDGIIMHRLSIVRYWFTASAAEWVIRGEVALGLWRLPRWAGFQPTTRSTKM